MSCLVNTTNPNSSSSIPLCALSMSTNVSVTNVFADDSVFSINSDLVTENKFVKSIDSIIRSKNQVSILRLLENSFVKKEIFNTAYIPEAFIELSKAISSKNNLEEVREFLKVIIKLHSFLLKDANKAFFVSKNSENFYQSCLKSLAILEEYVSHFYDVSVTEDLTQFRCVEKKEITVSNLISCFEGVKKLEAVEKGETEGDELGSKNLSTIQATFNDKKDKNTLSLGSNEELVLKQRIFSLKEMGGTIFFSMGCEAAQFAPAVNAACKIPGVSPSNMANFLNLAGGVVMATGFAFMTTSSMTIGYKVALQRMLLANLLSRFKVDQLSFLSPDTLVEISKTLPSGTLKKENFKEYNDHIKIRLKAKELEEVKKQEKKAPNSENSTTQLRNSENSSVRTPAVHPIDDSVSNSEIIGEEGDIVAANIFTSVDAKVFFGQLLKSSSLTYEDVTRKIHEKCLDGNYNPQDILFLLRNCVTKRNGIWGNYLDHIFSKLNISDKQLVISELGTNINNLFGIDLHEDDRNEIDKKAQAEFSKAIGYVAAIISKGSWNDRHVATRVFSKLVFDIQSCNLTFQQKRFLLNMLQNALKERGEIADKSKKRASKIRDAGICLFYLGQSLVCFLVTLFVPVVNIGIITLQTLAKVVSGGFNAVTFGALGYAPHFGANDFVKGSRDNLDALYTKMNEVVSKQTKDPVEQKINEFMSLCKEIQEIQDVTLLLDKMVQIKMLVKEFQKLGIAKFILEFNHGNKDCPLFLIQSAFLSSKNLKQVLKNDLDEILMTVYKEQILEEVKEIEIEIGAAGDSMISEKVFKRFMAKGLDISPDSKSALIYSAKIFALLAMIKKQKYSKKVYENCFKIFQNALNDVKDGENSGWLNLLTKRHVSTAFRRRITGRVIANFVFAGLAVFIMAIYPSSILVISFSALFYTMDYMGRKVSERFDYSAGYRYYEAVTGYVDFVREKEFYGVNFNPSTRAVDVLYGIEKNSNNIADVLSSSLSCLENWEKNNLIQILDKLVISRKSQEEVMQILRKEIDSLMSLSSINKEEVAKSIVSANYLIAYCNTKKLITARHARDLTCYLAMYSVAGPTAKILQTRRAWGSDAYLLGDFLAGFLTMVPTILCSISPIQALIQPSDAACASSVLVSCSKSFALQVPFDVLSFSLWMYTIDVTPVGITGSYQKSLGALKKAILFYTEDLEKGQKTINKMKQEESDRTKQEESDKIARTILGIKKGTFANNWLSKPYNWIKPETKSMKMFSVLVKAAA